MTNKMQSITQQVLPVIAIGMCLLALLLGTQPAAALNQIPEPDPKPGSYGVEATKPKAPPKVGARITTPGNGASFSTSPITVSGICPNDLLVQILNNGVMVGAVMCKNGSFSLKVSLFSGKNELSALVYDELDQAGPKSNVVTVTYRDTNFNSFGDKMTLTSSYSRRSAQVGNRLSWPLQLDGGKGPYAFSIDWGDGAAPELKSQPAAGVLSVAHAYKKAGIYQVSVAATDVNGLSAYLQLIAVSSGQVDTAKDEEDAAPAATKITIDWIPTLTAIVLLPPAFWLGRRSQLVSIRNKMLKERDAFKDK